MSQTITTSATVRVALSFNFNTFEVSMNLENKDGIQQSEINAARLQVYELAKIAVEEVRVNPLSNPKQELRNIENKLRQVKSLVDNQKPEPPTASEADIKAVEALPLYEPKKVVKGKFKK